MQAAQPRRYAPTGTTIAAVTAAILLIGALVVMSFDSGDENARGSSIAGAGVAQFDQIQFLEANIQNLPYTALQLLSHEEMTFLEINSFLPQYSAPTMSYADLAFWEANTMLPSSAYVLDPYPWGVTAR